VVDLLPTDGSDPAENALTIRNELEQYDEGVAAKPRWLIFNKIDLLLEDEVEEVANRVIEALEWDGPVHYISAYAKLNLDQLSLDILSALELMPRETQEQVGEEVEFKWDTYHEQTIAEYEDDDFDDDDDDDDDDYGVEVIYQR